VNERRESNPSTRPYTIELSAWAIRTEYQSLLGQPSGNQPASQEPPAQLLPRVGLAEQTMGPRSGSQWP